MDEKERYERESKAKAGSVPPELRHHSKARSKSAKESMIENSHDKKAQREHGREMSRIQPPASKNHLPHE